ncbi:MAG: aspartyl-tRNA(Asn)/glutamyl-tRNA(Gln) amidotransferase subunit A [Gammaproteobacteria bacterium]|jgi:aspartyl-tRNA(Asn)/glutamyl-tRNA(Gln) amidotransferase subunit A
MTDQDLCFSTIGELSTLIASREVSPIELTTAFVDRIEQLEPHLNAFIAVCAERALTEARTAEREIMSSGPRSPLHGIPLAVKDIADVKELPTTCGSAVLANNVPDGDATVVQRLESAGAILLGKLNMNEFATLVPSEHFGPTINPWSTAHSPGGSSSGSGVAVAAGLCAAALGTDTGGSIRIPSTFCSITGLKATFGRISVSGVVPLAWSLDHIGPMTRSARDASLLLDCLAGYDPTDLASKNIPLSSASNLQSDLIDDLSDLKIAVATNFFTEMTDPEVQSAMHQALDVLRDRGAKLEEIELPDLSRAWQIADAIIQAEATSWHAQHLAQRADKYGPKVRKYLQRGQAITAQDYVNARGAKARLKRDILDTLDGYHALITPGSLIPAPPLDARTVSINHRDVSVLPAIVSATCPFNLTGQPVLAIPCGLSQAGLPLGIQIVAPPWQEPCALRIGQSFQSVTNWHLSRPNIGHIHNDN